jgi:general secretion pathway protein N
MRLRAIAALGVAAYLVFLAAGVPASFVAARVSAHTQGRVQLIEPEGTAWNGKARAIVTSPSGAVAVDHIEWQFRPARLASLRLAFDVRAALAGLDAGFEIGRSPGAWEARDVKAAGDVAALSALFPLLAAWRPEGTFSLASPAFSWDGRTARGEARLTWGRAAVALSAVRPLGNYHASLNANEGPVHFRVNTLEGALRIEGKGTFTPSGQVEFSGDARAEGANTAALDPLLDLLGPRRADGSRALAWRVN